MLYACIYILLQTSICAAAMIKATYKAAPGKEERKKMQDNDNPSYLPTEMPHYESQGHQCMSVKLAPPDAADVDSEEHAELQTNPAYLSTGMPTNKSQEHQYMSVKLAPLAVADVEGHAELKANPAYLPIEMMKNN